MKAALLYLFAASAWAQTLTPVTAPAGSGIPFWVWPVAGVVIVIAGFVWLKFKSPATAAKVQTTLLTDGDALGKIIASATAAAVAHLQANPTTTQVPATTELVVPAADPLQPQLEAANDKLARIKAIVEG